MRADTSTPAVVLKLDHQGGLGVARSLGRLGVRVYGVHRDPSEPVPASRFVRETFAWDIDARPHEETIDFLLDRAAKLGARPLLVATEDVGALLIEAGADELREAYLFPEQPPGLAARLYSKAGLHELATELGVPRPDVAFPQSRADVEAFLADATLPVVVKPIDAWRLIRRGGAITITETAEQVLETYDRFEEPGEPNLMLQEYIPGGIETIWMFNGYFDGEGRCLVSFTGRKLRQRPPYTGMTSLGVCVANSEVEELSKRWLGEVGYRGVVDMGYRYDARDGRYKVLDVNPRVGATFRLFSAPDGMDVVRAMYLDLTGQHVAPARARDGRKWIVEPYDVASSIDYWRDGSLRPGQWLRSLRGVEEAAWFALDDPVPFLRMCAGYGRRALRR